jgi:hypothetical protein
MLEVASVRAAMDPGVGQSGVIDFFNTFTVGLQAIEPGSESAWVSAAGRSLIPVAPSDHTAPTTMATLLPTPNAAGWNSTNVTVALTAQDEVGGSGVKEIRYALNGAQAGGGVFGGASTSVQISAEGTTIVTYFAVDNAGNQEIAKTVTVRIDKTPPTVAFGSPSPVPNAAGWNNTDVSIPFTTTDTLSGVDPGRSTPSPAVLTAEGTAVTTTITVVDNAGNATTFTSPAVKIDKTPPTVACVPVARRGHDDDDEGKRLFRVSASDTLSQVAGITLGGVSLAQGEIIQIHSMKRSGVRLVSDTDDDDRDEPRFKRFRVGPGEAVIRATDFAGNVGAAVCPLPARQHGDDGDRRRPRND